MSTKLGQLLINEGAITPDQLELALAEQKRVGAKLGTILVDLGLVSDDTISRSLATQNGVEHVDLLRERPTPDVLELVSQQLASECEVLPLRVEQSALVLAMANPTDIIAIDRVQRASGLFVRAVSAPRGRIRRAIASFYRGGMDEELEAAIENAARSVGGETTSEAGVIALVERILTSAIAEEATDVHLEPDEKVLRVRLRVNGELRRGATLPAILMSAVVARIKVMAELDITETRLPQDGKIRFEADGKKIELRVSTFPSVLGESVVLRILDPSRANRTLESLGLSKREVDVLERAAARPNGLVLVTGPTGSGKTTTLYGLLRAVSTSERKTITLEDPVEYQMPLVTQCQINERAGLTFVTGLRSILRHDPDVILVGEMRDAETASIAVRAALTGHLVLSTLHTNDAIRSLARLRDLGLPSYLTASCLLVVVAQRLVRLLCPDCRFACEPTESECAALGLSPTDTLYRSKGCDQCRGAGSRGRGALFEVLEVTSPIARLISADASSDEIVAAARASGFESLREAALRRARGGEISPEEVGRVTSGD